MSRKEVSIVGRAAGLGPAPQPAPFASALSEGTGAGGSRSGVPQGAVDGAGGQQ